MVPGRIRRALHDLGTISAAPLQPISSGGRVQAVAGSTLVSSVTALAAIEIWLRRRRPQGVGFDGTDLAYNKTGGKLPSYLRPSAVVSFSGAGGGQYEAGASRFREPDRGKGSAGGRVPDAAAGQSVDSLAQTIRRSVALASKDRA